VPTEPKVPTEDGGRKQTREERSPRSSRRQAEPRNPARHGRAETREPFEPAWQMHRRHRRSGWVMPTCGMPRARSGQGLSAWMGAPSERPDDAQRGVDAVARLWSGARPGAARYRALTGLPPRHWLLGFSDEARQRVKSRQPRCVLLVADVRIEGPVDRIQDRDGNVDPIRRVIGAIEERRAAVTTKRADGSGRRHVLRDAGVVRDDSKCLARNGRPRHERRSMHTATTFAVTIGGEERRRGELDASRATGAATVEKRVHDDEYSGSGRLPDDRRQGEQTIAEPYSFLLG
jgi:hypothetical protein